MIAQKDARYRNPDILRAARGEECQMRSPYCNHDPATTVAAHSNAREHGKAMGRKSHDIFICFACSACHDFYDGRVRYTYSPKERHDLFFVPGMYRTQLIIARKGIKL